jgi:phosphate transport system permease protein/phosphate transport system substrate-binding protein
MRSIVIILVLAAVLIIGCVQKDTTNDTVDKSKITITGAGASFPYPLISKWAEEYKKQTGVTINYQSIGSGGGIRQIIAKTVDFGASDAPMTPSEYEKAPGILHIPETIGAVVVVYNIPELDGRLKLSGEVIADIYLGKITKWNDPRIAELNPDLNLPDKEIVVVKRADGSGTTYIFTDYLSSISTEWAEKVGRGKVFNFPAEVGGRGVQAKGNEGVTATVKQNPYSIGYVELAYAVQNKMTYALIRNQAGNFVDANVETIAAAAANSAEKLPKGDEPWYDVSIVNAPGENSYPISSFSYLLVYKDLSYMPEEKAKALVDFLKWAVTDGQKYAEPLYYVPLPEEIQKHNLETISMIKW